MNWSNTLLCRIIAGCCQTSCSRLVLRYIMPCLQTSSRRA